MRLSPSLLFALKAALAVAMLALLARLVDPAEAIAALAQARVLPLALAALLAPVNVALETYRWWRLVRRVAPEVRYGDALTAVLGGYPMGLLTPGRIGEYAGRSALLRGVPKGQAAALTFVEKMATLASVLIGGMIALAITAASGADVPLATPALVGVTIVTVGLVGAILNPAVMGALLKRALPFAPVRRALEAFDTISTLEAARLLGLSLLRYVVFAGQFVLLVLAFAPEAPLASAAVGVALVLLAKSAVHSITPGDLGVREGAAVFFLGAAGVPQAAALDAALGVFVLNLLLPSLVGVPLLMRRSPAPAAG